MKSEIMNLNSYEQLRLKKSHLAWMFLISPAPHYYECGAIGWECWMPQRKIKPTWIIKSTTFNCWCKRKRNSVCEHKFLALVSNFLFNLPVYIAPIVCIMRSSCWVISKWLLELFIIQGTHYQLPKLLQLGELPEWDSSTKAGNVSVNMKLDFNDFNSAVVSFYGLHSILNRFIVWVSEVFRGCYTSICFLWYEIILNCWTTKLKSKTVCEPDMTCVLMS